MVKSFTPKLSKVKFNPSQLMDRAIEAMRESVHERRSGGDMPPKVGAVLWFPDGTVETASRGELRNGDHAEFTLLERKNRSRRLDDAILFATLEPCAPGARSHPKLACAERIVNARIKEVWVGVQDPHPKVGGRGFEYLKQNGVKVHLFDRDRQEVIKGENKEFFAQAEIAAEKERRKVADVVLSEYESPLSDIGLADFSPEALADYRRHLSLEGVEDTEKFYRRLELQGLVESRAGKKQATGFGALLFGAHPRDTMAQAGLLGTIHYPDGKEEVRDFDGPMVLVPGQAIEWLRNKLPDPINRTDAQRTSENDGFFELIREGVVNALVHRDYGVKGAKCQLVVWPDSVVIKSPGGPMEPISLEQLRSFNAPMISRNPRLHAVFAHMDLAEERGLGLKSLKSRASEAGLPLPSYAMEDPYLVLTLYRSPEAAVHGLSPNVLKRLNDDDRAVLAFISSQDLVSSPALIERMKFDERKVQRIVRKLLDAELVERVGAGPATRYRVTRPGLKIPT